MTVEQAPLARIVMGVFMYFPDRAQALPGPQEYQEQHSGLDHLFLCREQVHDQLLAAGC